MDLNEIVRYYTVWRDDSEKELRLLKKRLSDVPVQLKNFKVGNSVYDFSEFHVYAEVHEPGGRIFLLDDLVDYEEADEITGRMAMPYLILQMHSKPLSDKFYKRYKDKLGNLILPDKDDKTARVLSNPRIPAVAVIYERKKPRTKTKRDIHYIEMILTKD